MDNTSTHSDEDTLAPMREPTSKRLGKKLLPGSNPAAAAGAGGARKSISLGARGAAMLSYTLAGGAAARRRSRDPTVMVRLENTYRMQPKDEERFSHSRVHPLVLEVLEEQLSGFDPTGSTPASGRKACEAAQAIRDRVKEAGFDRYKLVVNVCLFPRGLDCAAAVATRAVWATECGDAFVECRFQTRSFAAVATVHAFYYE